MVKIFGYSGSFNTRRVLFTAADAGVNFEFQFVDIGQGEHKSPEYLEMHPLGKTPALLTERGPIYESHSMCRYLAGISKNEYYYPSDPYSKAIVDQACDAMTFQLGKHLIEVLYEEYLNEAFGLGPRDLGNLKKHTDLAHQYAKSLNHQLSEQKYMAGNQLTLADSVSYSFLETSETSGFDLSSYLNINNWLESYKNRMEVQKIFSSHPIWGTERARTAS